MSTDSVKSASWAKLCRTALDSAQQVDLPDDVQIPTLPMALTRFIEAAKDPNVDVRALGQIVEHDPGLSLDLLKYVNMAAFGTDHPARTPTDALVRLGIPTARNFLVSAGVKSTTLGFKSRLMNHHNFWNESLQRALFAQSVAVCLKTDAELAFMGGLLQDFMLPVLTNLFDSDYVEFLRTEDSMNLTDWEQSRFGWDHAAAGATIAHRWKLPDELVCSIFFHHQMELPLLAPGEDVFELFPTTLAALLPDQLRQVPLGTGRLLDADAQSQSFDLKALCENVDTALESFCDDADRPERLGPVMERAMQKRAASEQFNESVAQ